MLGALAILAVVAGMSGSAMAGEEHCDARFQCEYHYQTSSDLWKWDFSSLCSPTHYVAQQKGRAGTNFTFNICGLSDQACPPFNNNVNLPSHGVAVQNYDGTCALAGEGAPVFFVNPANPQTGGINITHEAAPEQFNDPGLCAIKPDGTVVSRKTTYVMVCDPSTTDEVLEADELDECSYYIKFRSKYACGKIYDGADSQAAADKEAAERGAEAGAVIGFMILGSVLFVGGWAGIHYFRHRELPFSVPFVGNLARGPSSGGAAPATGSGFGSGGSAGGYGNIGPS